jgi:hypothetical protein
MMTSSNVARIPFFDFNLVPLFGFLLNMISFLFFLFVAAILFIKGYAELYLGKVQKKKVSYETIPQLTHAIMVLILLASISFHVALWPVYHSKSMLIMFLLGCFLFNFCLLMPTTVQNLVAIVLLTLFLQEYK